jgi:hypothetical protein
MPLTNRQIKTMLLAVDTFLRRHGEHSKLDSLDFVIAVTRAWSGLEEYEWRPWNKTFSSMRFTTNDPESRLALVFNYDGFDGAITMELNGLLQLAIERSSRR